MSSPTVLVQRMQAYGLDRKAYEVAEMAQSHFNQAEHTLKTSTIVLPTDFIEISMTPYTIKRETIDMFFMFELVSTNKDSDCKAMQFCVYGTEAAREVFCFLASQFYYEQV